MPNFKVRRKSKPPAPVVQKMEEMQIASEGSDATSDSSDSFSDTPSTMEVETKPQKQATQEYYEYQEPERRTYQQQPPRPARRNAIYGATPMRGPYRASPRNPYLGQPRSLNPPNNPRGKGGRRKMQFRSHYGPNGDYLDTHTKARLLLSSCFG